MTYTWTDNMMRGGTSCDVDKVADNLMHLKYDSASLPTTPFSVNSAKINASGYADFIETPYTFNNNTPWTQPVATSNTYLGGLSGTEYSATYAKWKAFNGVRSGTDATNNWIVTTGSTTGYFDLRFLTPQKITEIKVYNACTTNQWATTFRIWTDSSKTVPLTDVITAVRSAWGLSTISVPNIISKGIYFEILSGDANAGIGQIDITAIQPDNLALTSVKVLATSVDIVQTDVLGRTHTTEEDYTITGLSSDGTYEVIQEFGLTDGVASNPVAVLSSNISEVLLLPTTVTNGKYITVTGVKPMRQYKGVSDVWVETTFNKLGGFTKTGGVISTPYSYAFNGFTEIIGNAVALNNTYTYTHNLGTDKIMYEGYFDNITGSYNTTALPNGSGGYKIGEGAYVAPSTYSSSLYQPTSKTLKLSTGIAALWLSGSTNTNMFTGATPRIYVRRAY